MDFEWFWGIFWQTFAKFGDFLVVFDEK